VPPLSSKRAPRGGQPSIEELLKQGGAGGAGPGSPGTAGHQGGPNYLSHNASRAISRLHADRAAHRHLAKDRE
jgi:hypothetical protein